MNRAARGVGRPRRRRAGVEAEPRRRPGARRDAAHRRVGARCWPARNVVLEGYWDNPDATAEALDDGWFHTGDGGLIDDEGYLTIADRKKDVIISGGENVSSIEVEDRLFSHPAVAEVAVIGVPDEQVGRDGEGARRAGAGRRGRPSASSSSTAAAGWPTTSARPRSSSATSWPAPPPASSRSTSSAPPTGKAATARSTDPDPKPGICVRHRDVFRCPVPAGERPHWSPCWPYASSRWKSVVWSRSTTPASPCAPATRSASSAATAPARPRCCGCWPARPSPTAGSCSCSGGLGYLSQDPRVDQVDERATALSHVLSGRGLDQAASRLEKLRLAVEEQATDAGGRALQPGRGALPARRAATPPRPRPTAWPPASVWRRPHGRCPSAC